MGHLWVYNQYCMYSQCSVIYRQHTYEVRCHMVAEQATIYKENPRWSTFSNILSTRNVSGVCSEDTVIKDRIFRSQNFSRPELQTKRSPEEARIWRSWNCSKLESGEAGIFQKLKKPEFFAAWVKDKTAAGGSQNLKKPEFSAAWVTDKKAAWGSWNLEKLEFEEAVICEKVDETNRFSDKLEKSAGNRI